MVALVVMVNILMAAIETPKALERRWTSEEHIHTINKWIPLGSGGGGAEGRGISLQAKYTSTIIGGGSGGSGGGGGHTTIIAPNGMAAVLLVLTKYQGPETKTPRQSA